MEGESSLAAHEIVAANFNRLKTELKEFLKNNEEKMSQEALDYYGPQIDDLKTQLKNELEKFEDMQTTTSRIMKENARIENIILHLMMKVGRLDSLIRNNNSRSRALHFWIEEGTDKKLLRDSFQTIYIKNGLKRVFFRRWTRKMHNRKEQRLMKEIRAKYDRESKVKLSDYYDQIDSLEEELLYARDRLDRKQKEFIEMQQRLKKAFMRGVVNLNLEAMDVFNGSQAANLVTEVEGAVPGQTDLDAPVDESDDEFFVEEKPEVSVIRHR